jgi:Zn-dependent protease
MEHNIVDGIKWYLVFLFSTSCHEAAHAWSALRLGDDTAFNGGQVNLDPTPHIKREPFGMVLVPILSYFLGGWIIGWASTPYNPKWAESHPRRAAAMSLAGPAANLGLLMLSILFMRLGVEWNVFRASAVPSFIDIVVSAGSNDGFGMFCAKFLSLFFSLNLILTIFNLLPFPPLDGSNFPALLLPSQLADKYWTFIRQPIFLWLGLFLAWKIFGAFFSSVFHIAVKALYFIIFGG